MGMLSLGRLEQNKKKGFTLIELVIVLAIAALIIGIVIMAYGGTSRSQHDQASKTAAGQTISAVTTYVNDNPSLTLASVNTATTWTGSGAGVNYIKNIKSGTGVAPTASTTPPANNTTFVFQAGVKCNGATFATAPGTGQVAVMYFSEQGNKPVCVDNQ